MQHDLEEPPTTVRRYCLMPFAVETKQWLSSLVNSSRMLLPGSSLVREARREQAKIKGARRTERLSRWLRSWVTAIFETSPHAFWWILLVGLAGLYLLPSEVQFFRLRRSLSFFDDPTEASEFLQTLWQVEAAVLALSITVIVFAFQAVSISGYNIKLYEFAQDVHLFPVFYMGIVGLVVDGLVLLGFGNGAPAGGASSWAIIVSGSSFPLLALLFTNTVHAPSHRTVLAESAEVSG